MTLSWPCKALLKLVLLGLDSKPYAHRPTVLLPILGMLTVPLDMALLYISYYRLTKLPLTVENKPSAFLLSYCDNSLRFVVNVYQTY
jgi:hypothetical protein